MGPRSDPDPDPRSLDESKLFTEDGGVRGGEIATACWFCGGKTGGAVVARGRASRRRRRKMKSFMVMGWLRRMWIGTMLTSPLPYVQARPREVFLSWGGALRLSEGSGLCFAPRRNYY